MDRDDIDNVRFALSTGSTETLQAAPPSPAPTERTEAVHGVLDTRSFSKPTAAATIERWLQERLARELDIRPEDVDLDRSADSFAIDSVVVVQVCAELGNAIQGRELPIELWWKAPTLRAFCRDGATVESAPVAVPEPLVAPDDGAPELSALGAPLARVDAGRQLMLLSRVSRTVPPGERHQVATLSTEPEMVSVSYRYVDEATGEAQGTAYYGGNYAQHIRAWVTQVRREDGIRHDLYVLNSGTRVVEVVVAAWASTCASGAE